MEPEAAAEVVEQTVDLAPLLSAIGQTNELLYIACCALMVLIGAVVGVGMGLVIQRLFYDC